ncbi:putative sensory transduction regulatory protein [Fulvimarina pelagi HTCC2506]|uniref:Putative sensory transduction regulatory protein n=1 Tax=Fulvimarina pelagi HTCC2506 TaxID=314231 RepID=Q0G378_9HYPH|nr:response regulator [Fulvimarina pelagi]EAU41953.1 putative sensory transduction regulatory protein [Fulvimarina pelagi HTCC2506]
MNLLQNRRVLLVEDESLVAMMAEDMLMDLGCEVVVAMHLDQALTYAQTQKFDLAVLDVNLGGPLSYPVADLLLQNGTPFLFATGYGQKGMKDDYKTVPILQKPYLEPQLAALLSQLLAEPSEGEHLSKPHRETVPNKSAQRRPLC